MWCLAISRHISPISPSYLATSPYLILKVRRSHLIQDTLLRVSQHKRELKKPLKVQFLGEDGIDEGGVQKEFFQLIMAQDC